MNDSLDLRKRILKMRSINEIELNLTLSLNKNKEEKDLIETNKKKKIDSIRNEIKNENKIINKPEIYPHQDHLDLTLNSKKQNQISYDPQFRLLANKFNEAVEVILELSNKVQNLEKDVYLKNKKTNDISIDSKISNLKIIAFIILTLLFSLSAIYLPINLSIFKLILRDISSLI